MTTCASCGKPVPDQAVICRDETDLLAVLHNGET